MADCDHLVWLERIEPGDGTKRYWLMHCVSDRNGGVPPENPVSEHMMFNYCPLCGEKLDSD